jgi:iron complex outermembrane receptor protein
VFVITQDDIHRSGATSLPEVLRLAPGVQISRINSAVYAVGMRGFADRLSRAMLVLIDGRAVYSPLFAGTYWEVQDVPLADIERIEVIRGPGGTLWGANAVNGIINIITKPAADTQGVAATAVVGSQERGPFTAQYGGARGTGFHYRVYGQATRREPEFDSKGLQADTFEMGQGGFRADWSLAGAPAVSLQGDAAAARLGERPTETTYSPPQSLSVTRVAPLGGGNALMRWSGPTRDGGNFQVQTYFDRTSRDEVPIGETRNTFDIDFQRQTPVGDRQHVVWGAGYRVTGDRITASFTSLMTPARRVDQLFSAFAQDDLALADGRLHLIGGAKLSHNPYSSFEVQPSARAVWTMAPSNTLVFSVTRAVRIPSRVETDYTTTTVSPGSTPTFVRLLPNPDFQPEKLVAYEAGYRVQPRDNLYVTASGFYNHLTDILSTEALTAFAETDPAPVHTVVPVMFGNGLHGRSVGVELTADFRPYSWWRWTGTYSNLEIDLSKDPGTHDVASEVRDEGRSPQHQVTLQSSLDLPHRVQFDWLFTYSSKLTFGPVPAYTTSTVRLGWLLSPQIELAIVGDNLDSNHHLEWSQSTVQISRSAYVSVTWRR